MQQRWRLLKLATRRGWAWLWDFADHIERVLTVLAAFGISASLGADRVGLLGPLIATVVLFLVALAEGAFEVWRDAEKELEGHRKFQRAARAFRDSCDAWADDVECFLEARSAGRPGKAPNLATALRCGTWEGREEGEAHDRETVALYIEKHRDRGLLLFNTLVELEHIVPASRDHLRSPQDSWQIKDGVESVRFGSARVPVLD